MSRSGYILLFAFLSVSPGMAQQVQVPPVDQARQQFIKLLNSKGFSDASIESLKASNEGLEVDGIAGSKENVSIKIGSIKVQGVNPGYRWFRAKQILLSNVSFHVAEHDFSAEAILVNGLGVLDMGSARPSLAFDQLAIVNGN